jgi:hypothetical protein
MFNVLSYLPFAAAIAALGYHPGQMPPAKSLALNNAPDGRRRPRKPKQGMIRTFGLKYRSHIPMTCQIVDRNGNRGPVRVNPLYVQLRFHALGGHRLQGEDGKVVPIARDPDYRALKNARKRERRAARA